VEQPLRKSLQDRENIFREIANLVERGNDWALKLGLSDYENYINGDCEFFLEYEGHSGGLPDRLLAHVDAANSPYKVALFCVAERAVDQVAGEIRNLLLDDVGIDSLVVTDWGEVTMPFRHSGFFERIQKLVPSRFSMGLERTNCVEKVLAHEVCESLLHGYVKPAAVFAERELNLSSLVLGRNEWTNHLPVSEIESGSDVGKGISRRGGNCIYDGFVLFSEQGSFAGASISLKDVGERFLFANNFVHLRDVFRRIVLMWA
jgi:hypothetical protein